ncbi:MAG TPA: FAD-dependent oxidoreductase, partial [Bacillota bacterium]|nr:FAD-dependent oxidoreductase [Bacillota bacterium]
MKSSRQLVIIGGGPAGMGAALEARRLGVGDILVIERDKFLGGILQQCIHNGFGLHLFGEELTGVEYAQRFIDAMQREGIAVMTDTMVMEAEPGMVRAVNADGVHEIQARAIILAMGCRERTRGAINIPGSRPAGVYTAGAAQRLINIEGFLPGRRAVILGSGDIGLIMARRLTLEGAKVEAVAEIMPWSNGLARNIAQCLDDFNIHLLLSHTVVEIHGHKRLEGVTLARVDDNLQPIPGSERYIPCDLLLLSVGLIPENELSRQLGVAMDPVSQGPVVDQYLHTSVDGVFACGN